MSRRDREFARLRADALAKPLTRANRAVIPGVQLQNGIQIGLSVNK